MKIIFAIACLALAGQTFAKADTYRDISDVYFQQTGFKIELEQVVNDNPDDFKLKFKDQGLAEVLMGGESVGEISLGQVKTVSVEYPFILAPAGIPKEDKEALVYFNLRSRFISQKNYATIDIKAQSGSIVSITVPISLEELDLITRYQLRVQTGLDLNYSVDEQKKTNKESYEKIQEEIKVREQRLVDLLNGHKVEPVQKTFSMDVAGLVIKSADLNAGNVNLVYINGIPLVMGSIPSVNSAAIYYADSPAVRWLIVASATNQAVCNFQDPTGNGIYLKFDNNFGKVAAANYIANRLNIETVDRQARCQMGDSIFKDGFDGRQ